MKDSSIYHEKAYAKINLFLDIKGAREDNYHEIETIMRTVDLHDEIYVEIGDELSRTKPPMVMSDYGIYDICIKAVEAYFADPYVIAPKFVSIRLVKRIPLQAGLGGGSADAAAVLRCLNRRFGAYSEERLLTVAAGIGADVPFLMRGGDMLCTGFGQVLSPLPEAEKIPEGWYVIIKPPFSFDTKAAYDKYRDMAEKPAASERKLHYNIFEHIHGDERITEIKTALMNAGAAASCLCGSGSAVYGAFTTGQAAEKALQILSGNYTEIFCAETHYYGRV